MVLHFFKLLLSLLHLKPFRVYKNLWCSALNLYTLFPPKSADPLLQILAKELLSYPLFILLFLRKLSSNKDQSRKVENSSTTEFSNFEKSVALFKRHL